MKLNEINEYVRSNKLDQKYNESLNSNKINSVDNMFSSAKMVDSFFNSVGFLMHNNIDKEIEEKVSYQKYYTFLNQKFAKHGTFSNFLKDIAENWRLKDSRVDINEAVYYLINLFVISPINGKIKEIKVEKKVRNIFKGYTITNPTPEQDIDECWDLKVHNDQIEIYIQVKTSNFFYGLKRSSKYSFFKIERAAKKYDLPIFFVKEDNNEILLLTSSPEYADETVFTKLEDFDFKSMSQQSIDELSNETFKDVRTEYKL